MSPHDSDPRWVAFAADHCLARGAPDRVAVAVRQHAATGPDAPALVLDEATGNHVEIDVSGTDQEVAERYRVAAPTASPAPARRGRPRLGVVGREVTLLPRHWAWLDSQRGGASATLRRLVDSARRESAGSDRRRHGQDRTYRLMQALAGDRAGFEEACRALYGGDGERFTAEIGDWPDPVRQVIESSAAAAFDDDGSQHGRSGDHDRS